MGGASGTNADTLPYRVKKVELPRVRIHEIASSFDPCEHNYGELELLAGDQEEFTALDFLDREDLDPQDRLWLALHTQIVDRRVLHQIAVAYGLRASAIWSILRNEKASVVLLAAKTKWMRTGGRDGSINSELKGAHMLMTTSVRKAWVEARDAKAGRQAQKWEKAITAYEAGQVMLHAGRLEPRLAAWESCAALSRAVRRGRKFQLINSAFWDDTESWMMEAARNKISEHYGVRQARVASGALL